MAAILARIAGRATKALESFAEVLELDDATDALASIHAVEVERRLRNPEPFEQRFLGAPSRGSSSDARQERHDQCG